MIEILLQLSGNFCASITFLGALICYADFQKTGGLWDLFSVLLCFTMGLSWLNVIRSMVEQMRANEARKKIRRLK